MAPVEVEETRGPLELAALRLRSASGALLGMAASGVAVVVVLALLGGPAVGRAVEAVDGSVDASLALPDEVDLLDLSGRSYIYDGAGTELAVLDREVNREVVALDTVPDHVWQAVVTGEDRKFFEHEGYDPEGIGRALVTNVRSQSISQGGSTITQQLAKSMVGDDVTLARKIDELTYAMRLEQEYTKEQLLEQYLNWVFLGDNAYGIAGAAEEYFGVPYTQLDVVQAATIAGVIPAPNGWNPRVDPAQALANRNRILSGMVAEGYLAAAELPALLARPLDVLPERDRARNRPFVTDAIVDEFLTSPAFAAFGATRAEREHALYHGGLRIQATIDPYLQDTAEAILAETFEGVLGKPTGAIATVEPSTGRILAAAGGLDYGQEQFDLPTQGRRHPGSAFKPFVFAEAVRRGFSPNMTLDGKSPMYFEDVPGWSREDDGVSNYGGASYGPMPMRTALQKSVNTATAQLMIMVGPERVADLATKMGIDMQAATLGNIYPSLALGSPDAGMTPLEMASAYGAFANNGVHVEAHIIERITDREGVERYRADYPGVQALDPRSNAVMVDMMRGVVTGGTGTRAAIGGWEVAGKTGTTQKNTDAWFVGYTPVLSTAVWTGYAEGNITIGRSTTGGGTAAPLWRRFMVQALEGRTPVGYPQVVDAPRVRGALVTPARRHRRERRRRHRRAAQPRAVPGRDDDLEPQPRGHRGARATLGGLGGARGRRGRRDHLQRDGARTRARASRVVALTLTLTPAVVVVVVEPGVDADGQVVEQVVERRVRGRRLGKRRLVVPGVERRVVGGRVGLIRRR